MVYEKSFMKKENFQESENERVCEREMEHGVITQKLLAKDKDDGEILHHLSS